MDLDHIEPVGSTLPFLVKHNKNMDKMGRTIVCIDVMGVEKRRVPSKHYVYVIVVKWSDGSCLTIYRRYSRFFDLQTTLLDIFPVEGGTVDPLKRQIPFLPGKIFFGRSQVKDVAVRRQGEINTYCKKLITLPTHISGCNLVVEFFDVDPDDLEPYPPESKASSRGPKETKVNKISKPKKLQRYVAIAVYDAQEKGELSLVPGLMVEILEKSDTGWWFVNSQDEQGWVPCTYLEAEDGSEMEQPVRAESGKEDIYVCIADFEATNHDEISLKKGVAVSVFQKNVDGWFLVRYQSKEGYAPGTCLKKAEYAQRISMKQKSRLSGVEIIGSLQDISTLLSQEKQEESQRDKSPATRRNNNTHEAPPAVIIKQRSLERGGNFRPPPRRDSVKKLAVPITLKPERGIYVTICDFEKSVEDGLSFKEGEKVLVREKNGTGWWFVKTTTEEGWVPASYLEPYCGNPDTNSVYDLANLSTSEDDTLDDFDEFDNSFDEEEDDDDGDWYAQPDESVMMPPAAPSQKNDIQKRPLPLIPTEEESYVKADEVIPAPVRKPLTSRGLPPPPAPPEAGKKKEVGVALNGTSSPSKSSASPSKSSSSPVENFGKPEPLNNSGGTTALTAMLKAKFESRSSDSDGSKPQPGNSEGKPGNPSQTSKPMLTVKPSDVKKNLPFKPEPVAKPTFSVSAKPSTMIHDRQSKFSKPPPPSKPKVVKPKPDSTSSPKSSDKKEMTNPPVHVKSPIKPVSPVMQKKSPASESAVRNSKPLKAGSSIAERAAAFNKPAVAPQAKPMITGKPLKPIKPSKPSLAAKPQIPMKTGSKVSNIANSLNTKLHIQPSETPAVDNNSNIKQSSGGGDKNETAAKDKVIASGSASGEGTYVAVHDFVAENDGEISFNEGDEVEVVEFGDDWSYIRLWEEEGWAPSSYFQKV